jgi:hypothetical protein
MKPDADAANGVLIFVHIPKAGGTTLHDIIDRQYPASAVRRCDMQHPGEMQAFLDLLEEERRGIRCLRGHLPYGLHRYLPRDPLYITMLRDPIERFLSKYRHNRRDPANASRIGMPAHRMRTVEDFIDLQIERRCMNFQTRMIGGFIDPARPEPPFDPLPDDALDAAKAHLRDRFLAAGLVERFDEFLVLLQRVLGWKRLYYARKNVDYGRRDRELREDTRRRILALNAWDVELVRYAEALFDGRIRGQEASFRRDVERLRRVGVCIHRVQRLYYASPVRVLRAAARRCIGRR